MISELVQNITIGWIMVSAATGLILVILLGLIWYLQGQIFRLGVILGDQDKRIKVLESKLTKAIRR